MITGFVYLLAVASACAMNLESEQALLKECVGFVFKNRTISTRSTIAQMEVDSKKDQPDKISRKWSKGSLTENVIAPYGFSLLDDQKVTSFIVPENEEALTRDLIDQFCSLLTDLSEVTVLCPVSNQKMYALIICAELVATINNLKSEAILEKMNLLTRAATSAMMQVDANQFKQDALECLKTELDDAPEEDKKLKASAILTDVYKKVFEDDQEMEKYFSAEMREWILDFACDEILYKSPRPILSRSSSNSNKSPHPKRWSSTFISKVPEQ